MSTLVYLIRLKLQLQGRLGGRSLQCAAHRIFLSSLIVSAKYPNDNAPNNKHWAKYSHIKTDMYSFGFNRTEVNGMEKQFLLLLNWELRITEQDLYQELEYFLEPLRVKISKGHLSRIPWYELEPRLQEIYAATASCLYPVSSDTSSKHLCAARLDSAGSNALSIASNHNNRFRQRPWDSVRGQLK